MGNDVPLSTRLSVNKRSKGRCEVCFVSAATDVHHRKRRREKDHSVTNCLHLCRACHRRTHERPAASRDRGWIVSSCVDDPATVPVLYRGVWVVLTDEAELLPTSRPTGT